MNAHNLLLLASLILFILTAIGVGGRINLTAAGLACLVGSMLI
jgi:hypothetical protein